MEPDALNVGVTQEDVFGNLGFDIHFADAEAPEREKELLVEDKYAVENIDVYQKAADYIDDFEASCEQEGEGYEAPNFPLWSKHMEGLQNGFYIFAGFSNSGKTAFTSNLAFDYALNPDNHLFMLYYSLDDSKEDVIARMTAMRCRIPISVVRKPKRYESIVKEGGEGSTQFAKLLERRAKGIKEMKKLSRNFMVRDAEDINCIEKMLNHAKMVKAYLHRHDEKSNVIIVIDSLMDIDIDSEKFREERDRNTAISKLVKKYATVDIKCPIFGTAHVRKNSAKRVQVSDLKESGRYEYDARAVFLITNDVSRNGQNAEIYYTDVNDSRKRPVLEIYWAKNKASSFKERTYCYFMPEYSLAREVDAAQTEVFDATIYAG